MPRKPRIEYAGAFYHVMCRGDRREAVFRDDGDHALFLDTLGEAVVRCGWRVHAYVLMVNHYHMLLETPEPNLIAGMRWFQGTYTQRFHARHGECGHLFQGRYKALPVGREGGYLAAVAAYIHLNPARARGFDFRKDKLESHVWSSYPGYVQARMRTGWLHVGEVLGRAGLRDTVSGRHRYRQEMESRIRDMGNSGEPWNAGGEWKGLRRGWCFGDEAFRDEMLGLLTDVLEGKRRESFGGAALEAHDEAAAERLIAKGLAALGMTEEDLLATRMGGPAKYALAWLARRHTCVGNRWIRERLTMGTATSFAACLRRIENARRGSWGYNELKTIKNIDLSD